MIKLIASTAITLALAGAGTSMVAEAAKPGDFLYPVKTEVNERIRGWFVTEYAANISLQVDLIEERLKEIDALVAEGKLTPDLAAKAKAEVVAQVKSANDAIASAPTGGLSAEQKMQLSITAARLKEALIKYKDSLEALDAEAKKSTRKGGRSGSGNNNNDEPTSDIINDTIVDISDSAESEVEVEVEIDDNEEEISDSTEDESEDTTDDTENDEETTEDESDDQSGVEVEVETEAETEVAL